MHMKEEDMCATYPWSYAALTECLNERYLDFKVNAKYQRIRRPPKEKPKYYRTRYFDPGDLKSAKKKSFNPKVLTEFDKHHTRR